MSLGRIVKAYARLRADAAHRAASEHIGKSQACAATFDYAGATQHIAAAVECLKARDEMMRIVEDET